MRLLTIFWTSLARGDVEALEEAVREQDAALVQVSIGLLAVRAIPALASGPVLVVCATNKEASMALAAGADEVLRSGEVTRDVLQAAIDRARARAGARAAHSLRRALVEEDDNVVVALLSKAFGAELKAPLNSAADEFERLSASIPGLLDNCDDFVAWTSQTSRDTPRRIAARRLAGPSSEEVKGGIARLHEALHRARGIVDGMLRLSGGGEAQVSASDVVSEVVRVLRDAQSYADLSLETEGRCYCYVSRSALALTVTALVAHALESIRAVENKRGSIVLRVFPAEDAIVVEVEDNGEEIPADLRPDIMEPCFRDPTMHRAGLPGIRDRVRRMGGDLVADTGPRGSMIRMILPANAEIAAHEPAGDATKIGKALD